MNDKMKRILYVRSGPYQVDPNSYNLQELGLAAAFHNEGIQCDVVYYHKSKNYDEIIEKNGIQIKILWRHGIRLLRSGVYPSLLKKNFLNQYDAVICSEYSQIMSVLFIKKAKTYIYNGPYYNLFKIPPMELLYDKLFCNYIDKYAKKVFCKTNMSAEYLHHKGINNTLVTGVGLDVERFENEIDIKSETQNVLDKMGDHTNILYIGSISKRKNISLIIQAFNIVSEKDNNAQLVLIGKGNSTYVSYCKSLVSDKAEGRIVWIDHLDNAQTKFVYEKADIFLLPSIQEIFGMVLLEAMYFGLPVVSSHSAGADTLIQNNSNGIIVEEFDSNKWADRIISLLDNKQIRDKLGKAAHNTIVTEYMWKNIAEKMKECFEQ